MQKRGDIAACVHRGRIGARKGGRNFRSPKLAVSLFADDLFFFGVQLKYDDFPWIKWGGRTAAKQPHLLRLLDVT